MIPVPINPPVRIDGLRGRWIALGHCQDATGRSCWFIPAVAAHGNRWRPDWSRGQRGFHIDRVRPIKG